MAGPYEPLVKNQAAILYTTLLDLANPGSFKASPTLAAGDVVVIIDGVSNGNIGTLPTVTPAAGTSVKITLTAGEMNGDNIRVIFIDQTNPKEWADKALDLITTASALPVNVLQWNSTNVATPATAGVPEVNVKNINNVAAATPGASGGILISGSNSGTTTFGALTVTGATTLAALSMTTLTASGAVAFQSTFAVTTSTSLAALSATTVTFSGAVAFQSTFTVTTSTSLAALSATTVTFSGAVAFQSTFAVTTSTSLAALSCTTLTASGAVAFQSTFATTGTTTFNAFTVTNALTVSGTTSLAAVTTSGTVTFNAFTVSNVFTVSGATTLTGAVTASNASNNIVGIDVAKLSGDATAADNAEAFFDGTGYAGTNNVIPTVTLVNTLTTYTGNTPQTGDVYAQTNSGTFGLAAIKGYVDDIGTAGAGLTAVPWNAAWDAEVQSEVQDAIEVNQLDHLIQVADPGSIVANSSLWAALTSKSATPAYSSYVNTTDSLEALRDRGDAAWITATGFSTHSATDVWAVATRVLTAGTNIVLVKDIGITGFNDIAAGAAMTLTSAYDFAKGTVAMTEAYAANGDAPTPAQAFFAIHQMLMEFAITSTSYTVNKLDGTTAFVVTLDSAVSPTSAARN